MLVSQENIFGRSSDTILHQETASFAIVHHHTLTSSCWYSPGSILQQFYFPGFLLLLPSWCSDKLCRTQNSPASTALLPTPGLCSCFELLCSVADLIIIYCTPLFLCYRNLELNSDSDQPAEFSLQQVPDLLKSHTKYGLINHSSESVIEILVHPRQCQCYYWIFCYTSHCSALLQYNILEYFFAMFTTDIAIEQNLQIIFVCIKCNRQEQRQQKDRKEWKFTRKCNSVKKTVTSLDLSVTVGQQKLSKQMYCSYK